MPFIHPGTPESLVSERIQVFRKLRRVHWDDRWCGCGNSVAALFFGGVDRLGRSDSVVLRIHAGILIANLVNLSGWDDI